MKPLAISILMITLPFLNGEPPAVTAPRPQGLSVWQLPARRMPRPIASIERVLVISVDGLRPDVLLRCNPPNIDKLYHGGSYTFWARTTDVAVTLPSHTSMLTGAQPQQHGIFINSKPDARKMVYPAVPTLFDVAHHAGFTTAMVAAKSKFAVLNRPGSINWVSVPELALIPDQHVGDAAVEIILAHRPQVMFVHFGSVDANGHQFGWGSAKQEMAIRGVDAQIGRLMNALASAGVSGSTAIILSADHGGHGRGHGANDLKSRFIPWIAAGPGIRAGFDLTAIPRDINTEDTFATACWLMGIPTHGPRLHGRPIMEIMAQDELLHSISSEMPPK